jgi:hypothetical protein
MLSEELLMGLSVVVMVLNSLLAIALSLEVPLASPLLSTVRATRSASNSSRVSSWSCLSKSKVYQKSLMNLALCSSFFIW